MAKFYPMQPFRLVRDKSGNFPYLVGRVGFVIGPMPPGDMYEYEVEFVPHLPAPAWAPEGGVWSADGDEMEPIQLLPAPEAEEVAHA